jgi:hypothetical protein
MPAVAARTRSAEAPAAMKTTGGTSKVPGAISEKKASNWSAGMMPAANMPAHSPTEWPASMWGRRPMSVRSSAKRRPVATTLAPWASSAVPSSNTGAGRPKCSAMSVILGSNSASTPGNKKARRPPVVRRPAGENQRPSRPARASARATTSAAWARRAGVGSVSARRQGPAPWTAFGAGWVSRSAARSAGVAAARSNSGSASAGAVAGRRRRESGPWDSSTTWALMPPKPKAFTPARSEPWGAAQGSASLMRRKRVWAMASSGSSACSVGGSVRW